MTQKRDTHSCQSLYNPDIFLTTHINFNVFAVLIYPIISEKYADIVKLAPSARNLPLWGPSVPKSGRAPHPRGKKFGSRHTKILRHAVCVSLILAGKILAFTFLEFFDFNEHKRKSKTRHSPLKFPT